MRRLARAGLSCAGVLLAATPAWGQSSSADVATAQALFEDGKKAMQAGHYDEACPKLVESQRLDPGGGTMLAIALCHEGQGKTATAWGDFSLALEQARKDSRPERVKAAQSHIDALSARLAKVRIVVPSPPPTGLEVRRDGQLVGSAQWGTALPLDPGAHTYEARAPGKLTWTSTVPVADAGGTLDVAIPALQDAHPVVAAPAPASVPVSSTPPSARALSPPLAPAAPLPPAPAPFDWRTAGLVTGAVGLVGIGVGGVFGLVAKSKWHDAQSLCPNDVCSRANGTAGLNDQSSAGSAADTSTALFLAGGAVLVAGAAMLVFSPSEGATPSKTGIRIEPMVGRTNGISIGGAL